MCRAGADPEACQDELHESLRAVPPHPLAQPRDRRTDAAGSLLFRRPPALVLQALSLRRSADGESMSRSIGGQLRYDLLTDHARLVHRPADADGLRAAALELQQQGLLAADIGAALRLSANAVEQLLQAGEAP